MYSYIKYNKNIRLIKKNLRKEFFRFVDEVQQFLGRNIPKHFHTFTHFDALYILRVHNL